ncbi:MAG TPA: glycosyltransferase family 1 protein [Candidatus Acidoferrum sp.]|nr:glycosyltransferase family 1 protein [Candidatus Acidoferrum sp.]
MIVAVDSLPLTKPFARTGTHAYAANVLKGCLRIVESTGADLEFHAFVSREDNWATNGFASPSLRAHESRILRLTRLWRLGGMAVSTSLLRPDLVFLPAGVAIPSPAAPSVVAILDAMYAKLPEEFFGSPTSRAKFFARVGAKMASRVVTISNWSKKDLVEVFGIDPVKIEVTYLGYDKRHYNAVPPDPEGSAGLLGRCGIRKPFILCQGLVQLRKNVHRLIQAWDRLHSSSKGFDAQLVLAGGMGHGHEEILKVREASPNRNQIVLTGELPDAELAMLVKNASLCVIPSLYEGFCLPMVEAMACGIPTVASSSSCIPEVSGGVLQYFDPHSVEEMAEVIQRTLEDSDLRAGLHDRGLARAAEFSWERCARETLAVFTQTAALHG